MCPHSLGIGHLLIDLLAAVPFVASLIYYVKSKIGNKK